MGGCCPPFRCRRVCVSCRALLGLRRRRPGGGDRAQEPRRAGSCHRAGRRPGDARARHRRPRRHLGTHRRPSAAAAWLRPGGAPRSGRRPAPAAARRVAAPEAPRCRPGRPRRRRSMGQPGVRGVARVPPPRPPGRRRRHHRRHPLGGRHRASEPRACPRSTAWWSPARPAPARALRPATGVAFVGTTRPGRHALGDHRECPSHRRFTRTARGGRREDRPPQSFSGRDGSGGGALLGGAKPEDRRQGGVRGEPRGARSPPPVQGGGGRCLRGGRPGGREARAPAPQGRRRSRSPARPAAPRRRWRSTPRRPSHDRPSHRGIVRVPRRTVPLRARSVVARVMPGYPPLTSQAADGRWLGEGGTVVDVEGSHGERRDQGDDLRRPRALPARAHHGAGVRGGHGGRRRGRGRRGGHQQGRGARPRRRAHGRPDAQGQRHRGHPGRSPRSTPRPRS